MSEKTNADPSPKKPAWLDGGKPVPIQIRELRFKENNGVELPVPGRHTNHATRMHMLAAGKQPENGGHAEIALVPWLRQYAVVFTPEGGQPI